MRTPKRGRPAGLPTKRQNRLGIWVIHGRDDFGERFEHSTGIRDEAEAERELQRFVRERRHLRARGDDLTFAAGYLQWRKVIGRDCVASSLKKIDGQMWRLGIFDGHVTDGPECLHRFPDLPLPEVSLGTRKIASIDQEGGEIDDYFDALQDDPRAFMRYLRVGKAAERLEDASLLYIQSLVNTFLHWLIDNKRIASDLVPKIKLREAVGSMVWYTRDEFAAILDAAEALCPRPDIGPPARVYLFILAAYKSQARTNRILNSRWDLIDREERTWDFQRVYSPPEARRRPDASHLRGVKPAPFHHIDDELWEILQWAWQYKSANDCYILGSNASLYQAFKDVVRAAGVLDANGEPKGSCHALKHTGITHLLKGDAASGVAALDPIKVSEMSNTSPDTVMYRYSHAMPKDHAEHTMRSLSTSRRRSAQGNVTSLAATGRKLRRP
jgi:integrase